MIAAVDLLVELAQEGIFLWVEGGRLRYRVAPGTLSETHRTRIRDHRGQLVDLLTQAAYRPLSPVQQSWPLEWSEALAERAAIMEFDGGLPRLEAEQQAATRIRIEHLRFVLDDRPIHHVESCPESDTLSLPAEDEG